MYNFDIRRKMLREEELNINFIDDELSYDTIRDPQMNRNIKVSSILLSLGSYTKL